MTNEAGTRLSIRSVWQKWYFRLPIEAALIVLLWSFIIQVRPTAGPSMLPTIEEGSYVFVDEVSYLFTDPGRGDVIVFKDNGEPVMYFCKRVVGLPGEIIEMRRGQVYINGKPLREPYVIGNEFWELLPTRIGPNEVYAVGDNRGMAMASHRQGLVAYRNIIGRVIGKGYDFSGGAE